MGQVIEAIHVFIHIFDGMGQQQDGVTGRYQHVILGGCTQQHFTAAQVTVDLVGDADMHIQMRRVIGVDVGDHGDLAGRARKALPLNLDGGGFGHRIIPFAAVLEGKVRRGRSLGQVPQVKGILLGIHILVQFLWQDIGHRQLDTFLTNVGIFQILVPEVGLQRGTTELAGPQ